MDIPDDPSTTTTTDYDSGDSVGIDYVYEGKKGAERRTAKGRSPRRKTSPKATARAAAGCTCGAGRAEEDAEITVFEEDTDTEEERAHRRRPTKPRPSGPGGASGCDDKGHHKADKRKPAENKPRRVQTPYVEEYPDETPRPAILLKEHKIPRRSSTSDAKRVRDSEGRSPSSGSRGRSPTGKRLPPRPRRRRSKESPKSLGHYKRRLDALGAHEDRFSDPHARDFQSDSGEPGPASRRSYHESGPKLTSNVARSSAWNENPQPRYSSSWPLQGGSHLAQRRHERREPDYDSDDESDEHDPINDGNTYDEHHRLREIRGPPLRERAQELERRLERQREPHREPQRRDTPPPPDRDRERGTPPPPRQRPRPPRTVVSHASMATMDQGYRSVATSLCEVWRGGDDDWESPYASPDEDDFDSDLDEPIRLLRMEDLPSRRSSPRLLPPRGERRDFGFQASNHLPPPYPDRPSLYMDEPSADPFSATYHHTSTWPTHPQFQTQQSNDLFLLDTPHPLLLTTEPDAMTDAEALPPQQQHDTMLMRTQRPHSRASRWSSSHRRRGRGREGGGREGGWTHPPPLRAPRSRAVSPVFSARRTREFLSPRPTRAARFDFGAWGVDGGSRSSLGLGVR